MFKIFGLGSIKWLGLSDTLAPQNRSWLHYFGLVSSSVVASLGKGSQEAKIFANFHGAVPDENL